MQVTCSRKHFAVSAVVGLGLLIAGLAFQASARVGSAPSPPSRPGDGSLANVPGPPQHWYVAPSGKPAGDGTLRAPWDLATALAGGSERSAIQPGATIWVRGGTYSGSFTCTLVGTEQAPIIVRNYPGERAILDNRHASSSSLVVSLRSRHTWFWGLEFIDSDPQRITSVDGNNPPIHRGGQFSPVDVFGSDIKLINCIVHDGTNGIGVWNNNTSWGKARNVEIYGCLSFNNGWHPPNTIGAAGHGVYVQNVDSETDPSQLRVREAIIWNNFSFGLHAYSDMRPMRNFLFEGVISFNNGSPIAAYRRAPLRQPNLIAASRRGVRDVTIRNCYLYHPVLPSAAGLLNLQLGIRNESNTGLTMENSVIGGIGTSVLMAGWRAAAIRGNIFESPQETAQFVQFDGPSNRPPAGLVWERNYFHFDGALRNRVIVRPNAYEKGRANIVVYNWERRNAVSVDLAGAGLANGQAFEIRNVQNYFGAPVLAGVYTAARPIVSLPMTDTKVMSPIGFEAYPIPSTLPEFGAFVLLPVGAG